jgi:hypothetical protein
LFGTKRVILREAAVFWGLSAARSAGDPIGDFLVDAADFDVLACCYPEGGPTGLGREQGQSGVSEEAAAVADQAVVHAAVVSHQTQPVFVVVGHLCERLARDQFPVDKCREQLVEVTGGAHHRTGHPCFALDGGVVEIDGLLGPVELCETAE